MQTWQSLISSSDTLSTSDAIDAYQAQSSPLLAPLQTYKTLLVRGEDAAKFLQGQCTCDINRLKDNQWLLGAHCNPKGRMLSSFYAACLEEGVIALKVHDSIAEHARAAFQKYIVFSKAEITEETSWILGVTVAPGDQCIPGTEVPLPGPGKITLWGSAVILRLSDARAEIWIFQPEQLEGILTALQASAQLTHEGFWDWLRLSEGIAEIQAPAIEQLTPHEINFQLVDGVSFSKGCYTGQEIVSRMKHKAILKKHLYLAQVQVADNEALAFGLATLDAADQKTGMIVNACPIDDRQWLFLALINDDAQDAENAFLELPSRPKISWSPLPYAIPK